MINRLPVLTRNRVEWNGNETAALVKTVAGLHSELERQVRGENSQFYQKYMMLRNEIRRYMGKEILDPYQIVNLELAATKDLLENIAPIRTYANMSLADIDGYLEGLNRRFVTDLGNMDDAESVYRKLSGEYGEQQEMLNKLGPRHKDWLAMKLALRRGKRELLDQRHAYEMSRDSAYHFTISEKTFEAMETLLSESLHYSERIEQSATQLIQDIEHLLPALKSIDSAGRYSTMVESAVTRTGQDAETLIYRVKDGAERIVDSFSNIENEYESKGHIAELVNSLLVQMRNTKNAFGGYEYGSAFR